MTPDMIVSMPEVVTAEFTIWGYILVMLISTVIAHALQKPQNAKPTSFDEGSLPKFEEGTPQGVIFGDCWVGDWMILAYGNYRVTPIRKRISGNLFGKKQTVGYHYALSLHMGIGRGPLDELVAIKVGDKLAWSGSQTSSGVFVLENPYLFGGPDAPNEGGISGSVEVLMGEADQTSFLLDALLGLLGSLGGLVPAFRGRTTIFFDGIYGANNGYPKVWSFRWRRALQGWDGAVWYPEKAVIAMSAGAIQAMNPAHMIYECVTNRDWGRGLSAAKLDLASFTAAADALHAEGFGLCLRWSRQDSLGNFMQAIIDHIGGALYTSLSTGQIKLVLARGGYDPELLPLFTFDNGLLGIDDDDNGAQTAAVNEIIVKYRDAITGQDGQVRVQNVAAIRAVDGRKLSDVREYPGAPTAELAARLAQRDLVAGSGFLKRFKLRFDRRASSLTPAGLFRISDPTRGIENIVLRVGRIEEADGTEGTITITAVQDVYALPTTAYITPQSNEWVAPDTTPLAVVTRAAVELSYRDLTRAIDPANLSALSSTTGYVGTIGQRPNGLSAEYRLATRLGASGDFIERDIDAFTSTATLVGALSITGTAVTLQDAVDLSLVELGSAALIDNELLRVDALDVSTGAVTFARGCGDSVPAAHAADARVWFVDDGINIDPTQWTNGDTVQAKMLTITVAGQLDEGDAGSNSVTLAQRQYRPYPPGLLRVNSAAYPASITGDLAVSWAHRSRTAQGDQLVDTEQASVGPEAGTTYTLRIYDGVTLKRTYSGITGTSQTYSNTDEVADGGPFDPVRFTLHAVRDGVESAQGHDWAVART